MLVSTEFINYGEFILLECVCVKNNIIAINENIHKIIIPYKDIFTTVCTVSTSNGVVLFDSASFDEDVENYILPMLNELEISKENLKYVFISHHHRDHSGALNELLKHFPDLTVLTRSSELKEKCSGYKVYCPDDGETLLCNLKVVTIPGHTYDSMALLDTRTNTLLTGDALQVYGIFGSQDWGSNIGFPVEYIESIEKVRKLDIQEIHTAHDYHPVGTVACGNQAVMRMLDACIEPIENIRSLVKANFSKSDEDIRTLYNQQVNVPTITTRVVCAVREAIGRGKM